MEDSPNLSLNTHLLPVCLSLSYANNLEKFSRWCVQTERFNKIMVVDERWCAETKSGAKVVFRDKGGERWCAETMVVFGGVRSTLQLFFIFVQ